jgi:hypothetical protein
MANGFKLDDVNLKDPVVGIRDPLVDPLQNNLQKPPGFFSSLRNPLELIFEESLPASLYQWLTGNTKKKQAADAKRYLARFPGLRGTDNYKEAERIYNKFGYLLEDGDQNYDFGEVVKLAKKHPGIMGAELVNMIVADPYLLAIPSTFFTRLGRGVVNATRVKFSKRFKYADDKFRNQYRSDIKYGAAAALFTPLAFSTGLQLGEKGEIALGRTTTETTIGATAGLVLSTALGAIPAIAAKELNIPIDKARQAFDRANKNIKPEKLLELNPQGSRVATSNMLKELKKTYKDVTQNEFQRINADISMSHVEAVENGLSMAKTTAFKAAGFGAIGATAQFLTEPKDKLKESAIGFGTGAGIYLAAKGLFRLLKKPPTPEELQIDKSVTTLENALDTMHTYNMKLRGSIVPVVTRLKNLLPDDNHRRKVFHYIQGTRVNNKLEPDLIYGKPIKKSELSKPEIIVAGRVRQILDDLYQVSDDISRTEGGKEIIGAYRTNYLPLLWTRFKKEPLVFTKQFNERVTGLSGKFKFGQKRQFADINEGLAAGYKILPEMQDPARLLEVYTTALSRSVVVREFIKHLKNSDISPVVVPIGKGFTRKLPILINTERQASMLGRFIGSHYTKFNHPFLGTNDVYIIRGTEKAMRMIFDASTESELMSGIFTTNMVMKRLAVGFSFFHAGALIESKFFAGVPLKVIGKFTKQAFSRKGTEIEELINNPGRYLTEFAHANKAIKETEFNDVVRFAQANRLVISTPEDAGYDRFYGVFRSIDEKLKSDFGIKATEKVEKVFKFFDRITWDRIFTHAKLYTFLTQFNKILDPAVDKTKPQIYRKARMAAKFTNDAFGGQDWFALTRSIQNPIYKKLAQTTFQPGSRGYMQLLMFAPDWTISNLRIIGKSLPQFERNSDARRLYGYYFARAAIMYAVFGSALNYYFSGKSILENKDPTRIDLGDGDVLTFSKQLMEPFHWITDPQKTALKKVGSLPRTVTEIATNKQYLTTGYSPNITVKDDTAIEKALKIGGQAGQRFLPIWLQSSVRSIKEQLEAGNVPSDIAADVALDFVLGQSGHPRYKGPRYTQYKLGGLARNPYETLF